MLAQEIPREKNPVPEIPQGKGLVQGIVEGKGLAQGAPQERGQLCRGSWVQLIRQRPGKRLSERGVRVTAWMRSSPTPLRRSRRPRGSLAGIQRTVSDLRKWVWPNSTSLPSVSSLCADFKVTPRAHRSCCTFTAGTTILTPAGRRRSCLPLVRTTRSGEDPTPSPSRGTTTARLNHSWERGPPRQRQPAPASRHRNTNFLRLQNRQLRN